MQDWQGASFNDKFLFRRLHMLDVFVQVTRAFQDAAARCHTVLSSCPSFANFSSVLLSEDHIDLQLTVTVHCTCNDE
jgi:hypothetical protein